MNDAEQPPTVLVIADDQEFVDSLRAAFGETCQIFLSSDIEKGLKVVERENLCAVLVNLGLPGLDAPAAIASIRAAHRDVSILGFIPAGDRLVQTMVPLMTVADGCKVVQLPMDWRDLPELLTETVPVCHGPPDQVSVPHSTSTPPVSMMPSSPFPLPASPGGPSRPVPAAPSTSPDEGQTPASTIIPFPVAEKPGGTGEDDPEAPLERGIAATFLRDSAQRMEHANNFEARDAAGNRVEGHILRVSPHFVVCEVLNPTQVITAGWQAEEALVTLARQEAYRGPARLSKAMNTGRSLICEWSLQGPWKEGHDSAGSPARLRDEEVLGPFFMRLRILQRISQVFKSVVAEVASLLDEAQQGLDRIEISLQSQPDADQEASLREMLPQLHAGMAPVINQVFERFEKASADIPADLDAEYHSLVRQHLHPYLMCSPFIHHIYSKPLGYAGDYGALQKLLGDPFEGHTLFSKLLNAWLVLNPAGEAYRTRLNTIVECLHEQAERCHERGQEFRVLSIGCGAANEVVRFAATDDLCSSTVFRLVDFNPDTLAYARKNVEEAMRTHWRMAKFDFVQMSVQGLILDEGRMTRKGLPSLGPVAKVGGYDFIYCTGLYDYFSDRVTRRLTQSFYNMLAPGGRLLVCNFTPANPIRYFMKYVLDWDLTHRTPEQMLSIAPAGAKAEQLRITLSPGDVEAYLHVTKPL